MSPRLFRIIIAFVITGVLGLLLAIVFLGNASTTGGYLLDYQKQLIPTEDQYKADEAFLSDYLVHCGFQRRAIDLSTLTPSRIEHPPKGYVLNAYYEHPIRFSRPVSIKFYSDPQRTGFWYFIQARNPTWAVHSMRSALKGVQLPLIELWWEHIEKAKAPQ
jgi:hypothetical protein